MFYIYGINNCDNCKIAKKYFSNLAIFQDIRDNPLSEHQINIFVEKKGELLINKKSKTWRKISDLDKKLELVELIQKFPLILKRPIIENMGHIWIGLTDEVKENFKS